MLTQEQVAQAIIITNIIEWDQTIIICCPRMDMAAAVLDRIYQLHDTLPDWIKHKLVYRQKRSAQFENGTRIILASDPCHLRGLAVSRAYIHDELRRSEEHTSELQS